MRDLSPDSPTTERPTSADDRLESWKEIGAYLKRDIRTVQRWERLDGLPVYRRPERRLGGVFAHRSEIDAWCSHRSSKLDPGGNGVCGRQLTRRRVAMALAVAAIVLSLALLNRPSESLKRVAFAIGLSDPCSTPRGIVGAWHAEWDARDAAGDHHGVLEHGTTFGQGRIGQAFLLNGQAARVRVPAPPIGPATNSELTVAAWVRFRSVINPRAVRRAPYDDMSLVDRMAPSPDRMMSTGHNLDGWRLLKQSDHRFWFCLGGRDVNRCGSPTNTVFSTTIAVNDEWYHVAAVKSAHDLAIYVNGAVEDLRPAPPPEQMLDTARAELLLGFNADEAAFLNGALDEVMLFERALSPAEVRRLARSAILGCRP